MTRKGAEIAQGIFRSGPTFQLPTLGSSLQPVVLVESLMCVQLFVLELQSIGLSTHARAKMWKHTVHFFLELRGALCR